MIEFFDEQWPLLYFELPAQVDGVELSALFAEVGRYGKRAERFGLVADTTLMANSDFPAGLRSLAAEGIRGLVESLEPYVVAQAYVVPWAETRGIITAIHWSAPVPWPIRVFGLKGPAIDWIRETLRLDEARRKAPARGIGV